ncbi:MULTISPECIES: right-handed parallel beta-helix repeat-containing protein [Paraburkholderia]|uniref:right-handed parallel beta-helix repeat-containing protein n=1 Tax=Paraburkholderia TaxID=1822464 RepID=UPI0022592B1E|nr:MULTISPECIES: right-handed parallel beta-helix repeat-containing protein [Paraburkholderia]MCX4155003.1 hypothetical protein [Paraburkholderia aspalathi]MDN7164413.1 hypothetical protein [Paraburkholderia sp. SECH2]MDQ6392898.1 hypothetical protein [Paraburkholderia aspalathi]
MSVTTSQSRIAYTGDGITTVFAFPYLFQNNADIKVWVNNVEVASGFTTTGASNASLPTVGGQVAFTTPPALGANVLLLRDPSTLQKTVLAPNDPFPAKTVETMVDGAMLAIQRLNDILALEPDQNQLPVALSYPFQESGLSGTLPVAATRANGLLGFDANGLPVINPLTASVGAGNLTIEGPFIAGTNFAAGTSNSVTLSQAYGSKANLGTVVMAGIAQSPDSYTLSGNQLIFNAVIPQGVDKIWCIGGTTLSIYVPAAASVDDPQLAWGSPLRRNFTSIAALRAANDARYISAWVESYYGDRGNVQGAYDVDASDTTSADNGGSIIVDLLGRRWKMSTPYSLKKFGAKGDWNIGTQTGTDDSAAFNAAVAATQLTADPVLIIDAGNFYVPGASSLTGRLFLKGNCDGMLVGALVYSDLAFPTSADTVTPLTNTAPFFRVDGVNFSTHGVVTSATALTVAAQVTTSFIDTFELFNCRFYGWNGLLAQSLTSANLDNCWFYTNLTGVIASGCVNWNVSNCRFRQQVQYGFAINPYAPNPVRNGGENIRFSNCEFVVCATGVLLQQCLWARFTNCLFDYCVMPLNVDGSKYVKLINTYLGVSNQASVTGNANYQAPPVLGCALYVHGHAGTSYVTASVDAMNCEFISYIGGAQPMVTCEGSNGSFPGVNGIDWLSFINCLFYASAAHSMPELLYVDMSTVLKMYSNIFQSLNLSSTLVGPYTTANVSSPTILGSDTTFCQQSSVSLPVGGERALFNELDIYNGASLRTLAFGASNSGGAGFRSVLIAN